MTFMMLFHTGQGKKKRETEALVTNMYQGPMTRLVVVGVPEKRQCTRLNLSPPLSVCSTILESTHLVELRDKQFPKQICK